MSASSNSSIDQIVSFHCIVKDRLGRVLSSSFNQNVSTGDSPNGQLLGFSRGMRDIKVGERRRIYVNAGEAYGFYDPSKILEVEREDLPEAVRIGDVVSMSTDNGDGFTEFRVIEFEQDVVVLDSNHPLAGQDLIFEIEATSVKLEEAGDFSEDATMSTESNGETRRIH